MNDAEPDLSRLTPAQRFRWRVSAANYDDALAIDATKLEPEVALIFDRTRSSLGDMIRLMTEHHGCDRD